MGRREELDEGSGFEDKGLVESSGWLKPEMEQTTLSEPIQAIRCDHDGLKMAEIKDGHLILRAKHHGETHIKIVPLGKVEGTSKPRSLS